MVFIYHLRLAILLIYVKIQSFLDKIKQSFARKLKHFSSINQKGMRFLPLAISFFLIAALGSCDKSSKSLRNDSGRLEILFLGHNSEHHNSSIYLPLLASHLATEGITFTYTNDPADLNPENLDKYDGLMIYANHDSITSEQEAALLSFVEKGKGFIPVHCASFCFRNSQKYVELVGGQFMKHKTDSFSTSIINKDHYITKSLREFYTWDETYEH